MKRVTGILILWCLGLFSAFALPQITVHNTSGMTYYLKNTVADGQTQTFQDMSNNIAYPIQDGESKTVTLNTPVKPNHFFSIRDNNQETSTSHYYLLQFNHDQDQTNFSTFMIGKDAAMNWTYPNQHQNVEFWICTPAQFTTRGNTCQIQ